MRTVKEINYQVSEVEFIYKSKVKASERPQIKSSIDATNLLKQNWDNIEYFESFKVIYMNRANKVLAVETISKGGISGTVADEKLIFQRALVLNASQMILSHNHPSGTLNPSKADIQLTRKLKDIGLLLSLPVLDHIILSDVSFYSFADDGLL